MKEGKKKEKEKKWKVRIGSVVVVFPRDPCDVWAVRFPREKRATTWAKSERRASMMRQDTGATRKNIRPLFFAVTREDNGIPFDTFCLLDLSREPRNDSKLYIVIYRVYLI